jgi:hypothetical protein
VEFAGAELGDWRLQERLVLVAQALDAAPAESLPKAARTPAAQEGMYKLLRHESVTMDGVLGPHVAATVGRCRAAGSVYVISDSSEFSFSGPDRGEKLGRLSGKGRGFIGHFALAVSADGHRTPLGVLGIETLVRSDDRVARNSHQAKRDPQRESLRWGRMVKETSEALGDVRAVHVMDSESDIFELLSDLSHDHRSFIIRSGQDRLVEDGHLYQAVEQGTVLLERTVHLSARPAVPKQRSRRHPVRLERDAHLEVSALRLAIRRPKTCETSFPKTLEINVVRVREARPPEGEEPVEWILLTSEPVSTSAQVAAVVDGYRARWLIEEYFKALKTGCAYESRQLESLKTLTNLLGIFSVIAWRLLLLRSLHRQAPDADATEIFGSSLLEALASNLRHIGERRPFPARPTITDVFNGIALLGGHIRSNGSPGWQVLWRGYRDLLLWASAYFAGKLDASRDQS